MSETDWRHVAVQLARAGDGSYRLLTTSERDALEGAVQLAERVAADVRVDATAGTASRGEST